MISLPRWAWVAFAVAAAGLLLLAFSLGTLVGSNAAPAVTRWVTAGSTYAAAALATWFVVLTTNGMRSRR